MYTTFKTNKKDSVLYVTFDFPPVNIQGVPMIADLNRLCDELENNREIKVVVFQSANPEIFIAHTDIDMLQNLSEEPVPMEQVKLSPLQMALNRIAKLPQATIAKIEGMARGGGHELALACDMRFAARGKAVFMQMEVGMGVLPCGGGSSRMARQTGLGKALEIILSAQDFGADEAEQFGTINRALDPYEITEYVDKLATRISKFPSASIENCKRMVYASIDMPIEDALLHEDYHLYQCTSQTSAVERFKQAAKTDFQDSLENQRNFEPLLMTMQNNEA
ncbi:enoyl-CoA hydratase/isomerase family protein [Chakrabartyella piscis]|uniref:enoyl-CoA hydratase/isomerase family protein n=1 Tax=Chakrabartyella piscis TaxID=2918914 RepID=UPI0029583D73|nr:enoyl-CoA hydratase/isomerase family protein [Chakrabartyella piscis]